MSAHCKLCQNNFKESPDSLVMCSFKDGAVHLGCCIDNCSGDKKPCQHSHGIFDKLTTD